MNQFIDEIEKTLVFPPHTVIRGRVLEAWPLDSIPRINSEYRGNYEVDLIDRNESRRTFKLYGRLPEVGTEQAYSSENECVNFDNRKFR